MKKCWFLSILLNTEVYLTGKGLIRVFLCKLPWSVCVINCCQVCFILFNTGCSPSSDQKEARMIWALLLAFPTSNNPCFLSCHYTDRTFFIILYMLLHN